MNRQHVQLLKEMIHYDKGDPARIQHILKVHSLAAMMGKMEGIPEETQFILETTAILHDVGIHVSEQKYGSCSGKYQEIEGPAEGEALMNKVGGFEKTVVDRVKYLIGHHHTYTHIDGMDYQILVEADFLVNLFEEQADKKTILNVKKNIFRTKAGLELLNDMFGLTEE